MLGLESSCDSFSRVNPLPHSRLDNLTLFMCRNTARRACAACAPQHPHRRSPPGSKMSPGRQLVKHEVFMNRLRPASHASTSVVRSPSASQHNRAVLLSQSTTFTSDLKTEQLTWSVDFLTDPVVTCMLQHRTRYFPWLLFDSSHRTCVIDAPS